MSFISNEGLREFTVYSCLWVTEYLDSLNVSIWRESLNLEGENADRPYLLELWFFYICLMLCFGWFWFLILLSEAAAKPQTIQQGGGSQRRHRGCVVRMRAGRWLHLCLCQSNTSVKTFGQSPCRPEKCFKQRPGLLH